MSHTCTALTSGVHLYLEFVMRIQDPRSRAGARDDEALCFQPSQFTCPKQRSSLDSAWTLRHNPTCGSDWPGGALQAQVNTNTAGLAAVGNRVTTIEGTITTLHGQSTTNTTNITNLGNRVTSVETQTNTNTTSITNLGACDDGRGANNNQHARHSYCADLNQLHSNH